MTDYYVNSEVGQLKKVILHCPDLSLKRLTPSNCHEFLFDEVLWVNRARVEHNIFTSVLIDHGVEVLLLENLLLDILRMPDARQWLIDSRITANQFGAIFSHDLKSFLNELPAEQLAVYLLGGLLKSELTRSLPGVALKCLELNDFVLPPLPNHLFTRDSSSWIYGGVTINPMAMPVRKSESIHMKAIYRFHPLFQAKNFKIWYGSEDLDYSSATMEGGDVLVLGNGVVMVGMGERTTPQAVEQLALSLFKDPKITAVIAVSLPKNRAYMHLDTVLTMVDRDAFCIFPGVLDASRTWKIIPDGNNGLIIEKQSDIFTAISQALQLTELRIFTTGGDDFEAEREQWDDGNNLLAIAPGLVVGYERNMYTNKKLQQGGCKVITIPGFELGRGRGGARCMSCPIQRE